MRRMFHRHLHLYNGSSCEKCLICGGQDTTVKYAAVSDFLLERIWNNSADKETRICHCQKCGFAFYTLRPNENEMEKLYKNYRDRTYQKQRQKYDSWYTENINALFDDPDIYNSRQESFNKFLSKHVDPVKIRSVLDYGGNTGLHIPTFFKNADKFVFDISGVETIDGVQGYHDFDEIMNVKYDFVICSNLLEHITNPLETIKKVKELVREEGYIYIEVPFDSPFYKHKPSKIQYLFNKNFSFMSLLRQLKCNLKCPYVMAEHINYFTENSLRNIFRDENILTCELGRNKDALGVLEFIRILVKI